MIHSDFLGWENDSSETATEEGSPSRIETHTTDTMRDILNLRYGQY